MTASPSQRPLRLPWARPFSMQFLSTRFNPDVFLHSRMTCWVSVMSALGSVLGIMDIKREKHIKQCPTGVLAHKEIKLTLSRMNISCCNTYTNSREHEEGRACLRRCEVLERVARTSETVNAELYSQRTQQGPGATWLGGGRGDQNDHLHDLGGC